MSESQTKFPVPVVELVKDQPVTTSLKIAECFGKRHCDVLRDIQALIRDTPEDFHKRNFALMFHKVKIGKGAEREDPYYNVSFDGFMLLVMGYTGKKALAMKLAYIEAFNAMRERLEAHQKQELPGNEATLTPDQQCTLRNIVDAKVLQVTGGSGPQRRVFYMKIWNRFKNHFRLAKYDQLPQSRMAEAISYLVRMEVKEKPEIGQQEQPESPPADPYQLYLEEVEKVRGKTRIEISRLMHMGLDLLDARKFQIGLRGMFISILMDWLALALVQPSRIETQTSADDRSPVALIRELSKMLPDMRG